MMKNGVYAATLSVLDENGSLNIDETISHAENIINEGFVSSSSLEEKSLPLTVFRSLNSSKLEPSSNMFEYVNAIGLF